MLEIKNWPLGSPVLVYRKDQKGKAGWKGPFTLLGVEGKLCTVDQGTVVGVFCTIHVCPFRNAVPDDAPLDDVPPDDLPMDEEVEENAFFIAKEDPSSAIVIMPNIPLM